MPTNKQCVIISTEYLLTQVKIQQEGKESPHHHEDCLDECDQHVYVDAAQTNNTINPLQQFNANIYSVWSTPCSVMLLS